MKTAIVFLLAFANLSLQAQLKKYDKWEKVVEASQKENKDILIILTGKEWCAPCKFLENSTLQTTSFIEYAEARFVVFEIDVPKSHLGRLKSPIVKRYREYSEKYNAKAFPSLILTSSDGSEKLKVTESTWLFEDLLRDFEIIYTNE